MKALKSEIRLLSFAITKSLCEFISNKNDSDFDFVKEREFYSVDIDFNIKEFQDENTIVVLLTIVINNEKKSGYSIRVEGCGVFSLGVSERDDLREALAQSAVSICITNIRSFIANMTASYPFGSYSFPIINMIDLWNQKIKLENSKEKNTELNPIKGQPQLKK